MSIKTQEKNIRYLVSFTDEMISDSEKDAINKKILLILAETFLKKLLKLYENENINYIEGLIYNKLGWVKYHQNEYQKAEKNFLYALINLKNCKICNNEYLESYWGLINSYLKKGNLKLAKRYFIKFLSFQYQYQLIFIEDEIETMIKVLNITIEDFLKK
jgi:tetratricopeptide (TPR) repeat protein